MKYLSSIDRLKILVLVGDQIWEDFDNNEISEREYAERMKMLKMQVEETLSITFDEIFGICEKLGYMLVPSRGSFGKINNYQIAKN